MFFLGAIFGTVGLLTACFNIWGPDFRHNDNEATNERLAQLKNTIALSVQGLFVFLILLFAFVPAVRDPCFGDDPATRKQTELLIVVCVLFALACYPSFVAQGTLNEIAAHLPQRADMAPLSQLAWIGGVSCALLMGLLRVALRSALHDNFDTQGVIFLGTSAALSFSGIAVQPLVQSQLLYKKPPPVDGPARPEQEEEEEEPPNAAGGDGETEPLLAPAPVDVHVQARARATSQDRLAAKPMSLQQVLVRLWPYYFVMAFDFFYMMALYPGVLSVLQGKNQTSSFFTDILFLAFNFGDFVGKVLPSFLPLAKERIRVRIVLMCAEVVTLAPLVVFSALFDELHIQAFAYVLAGVMAACHGYISVCTIGAVSALAEHWHEVERRRAGELCFSSCFFGVGIGSLLAVGLNYTPLVSP